jgi:ubiquinone/menaquinone biosynthesis C-methylase UbiE
LSNVFLSARVEISSNRQTSVTVKSYFQSRANWFDTLYEEGQPVRYRVNRIVRRAIFERVSQTLNEFREWKDFSVLDVGCGPGRNSVAFVQAGAARVLGIDFSERMLEIAREFSCNHGAASKCEFLKADFMACSFSEKLDAVVALGLFDYIGDAEDALRRMITTAKYKVIGSFPRPSPVRAPLRKLRYALRGCPVYFYTRRQIVDMCQRVGLKRFEIATLASAGYLLVGSLDDYPLGLQAADGDGATTQTFD